MSTEKIVFLSGKKTILRPVFREDIPYLLKWINDPDVRQFVASIFPTTQKFEEDWVDGLGKDKDNIVVVIETKEGKPIGLMGLHRIDWVNRLATTGALIGDKEYWGKGFGTDAKMALLDYAFNTLNLNRINSDVIAFNERSLNYSLHCGYQVEGRKRQAMFRHGKYWDRIELGLLREEWLPLWEKYRETGSLQ
ncbi:MAG: GCN5-like N-acetyltransferase [Parcubacteria group bacterium Gr01-1014_46]|nr:MAG: GCN5-like N-acetyltransferase [Parcubacteria group bacterium Gr01-1014_46]